MGFKNFLKCLILSREEILDLEYANNHRSYSRNVLTWVAWSFDEKKDCLVKYNNGSWEIQKGKFRRVKK